MSASKFDDNVDFETEEEESSEYEEEEEEEEKEEEEVSKADRVKTVTVKLPPNNASAKKEVKVELKKDNIKVDTESKIVLKSKSDNPIEPVLNLKPKLENKTNDLPHKIDDSSIPDSKLSAAYQTNNFSNESKDSASEMKNLIEDITNIKKERIIDETKEITKPAELEAGIEPRLIPNGEEVRVKTTIKKKSANTDKDKEKTKTSEVSSELKFVGDSDNVEDDRKDKLKSVDDGDDGKKEVQYVHEEKVGSYKKLKDQKLEVQPNVNSSIAQEDELTKHLTTGTVSDNSMTETATKIEATFPDQIKSTDGELELSKNEEEKPDSTKLNDFQLENQRIKSKSPVSDSEKKEQAGRIEQTRNYLKALTPSEDDMPAEKEPRPKFEISAREDVMEDSIDRKEPVSPEWDTKKTVTDLENEDSDFTYRRKSMDEFIKKILEEAREEKEKERDTKEKSKKPPLGHKPKATPPEKGTSQPDEVGLKTTKEIKSKSASASKKSKIVDEESLDVDKELEEINKYFAKRQDNSNGKVVEKVSNDEDKIVSSKKKMERQKIDKDPKPKENGFMNGTITDEDIERLLTGKNRTKTYNDDGVSESIVNHKKASTELLKKGKQPAKDFSHQNGYLNHDDEDETSSFGDYLSKFKRDRQALFGGEKKTDPEPVRSAETEELIRDRTRNIRSVIDQQSDICENVKSVSKQLEELEKELREVRQISMERRGRLDALENAVNAEYKMFEIEHNAANDRTKNKKQIEKFTPEVKEQMINSIQSGKNKKGYRGEPYEEVSKRRVGSISSQSGLLDEQDSFYSLSPYQSYAAAPSRGRGSSSDRDYLLGSFTFDRKRDSSGNGTTRSRLSFTDNDFDSGSPSYGSASVSALLNQIKPRSRASVATMDTSTSISADDFLAKIRNKYSFLNPSNEDRSSANNKNSATGYRNSFSSNGYEPPLSSSSSSSSYSYSTLKSTPKGAGSNVSDISNILGNRYSSGKYSNFGGGSGSYDNVKSKRALSVSDVRPSSSSSIHYDRNLGGYTTTPNFTSSSFKSGMTRLSGDSGISSSSSYRIGGGSVNNSTTGEFKSRFLDKVREKKSVAAEHSPGTSLLADRVRARINSASFDLPSPPTRTKSAASEATNKQQEAATSPVTVEA